MASTHKHIRSSTANKRPTTAIADGQIALNTNSSSPGLFFKDSTGATIIKVGPVHIGATAPNATPPSGGSSGNSTGEIWLDTSLTPNGVKIWDGSAWVNATPIGSTTVQGLLELATSAETQTGSDTARAVTPAGLQSKVSDSTSTTSSTTIASSTAVKAAYDLAAAALPLSGGTVTGNLEIGSTGSLSFEGATADAFETTIAVTDPTADRTITLPDTTGTIVTTGDTGTVTSTMIANSTIVDGDISATAEIAVSKLADGAARQLLQTDAAGTGVEWTDNVDIPGTLDVTGAAVFDSTTSATGTSTAASFIPTSSTAPANGMYLSAANTLAFNTNTAASPRLVIDSSGRLVVGTSTAINTPNSSGTNTFSALEIVGGSDTGNCSASISAFSTITGRQAELIFAKSADNTVGSHTVVAADTDLGEISFAGSDGTKFVPAASILSEVDGAVGGDIMPGRLVFSTTASGAPSPTERLRIDSSGRVGLGTSSPGALLDLAANNTGITSPLSANNRLRFTDTDTTQANDQPTGTIEWYTSDTDSPGVHAYVSTDMSNNGSGALVVGTGSGGSAAERLRIDSSGRVGIGTTAPGTLLEVSSTTGTSIRSSYTNSTGGRSAGFEIYGDVSGAFATRSSWTYAGNTGLTSFTSQSDFALSTAGSERARIDSSGYLRLAGAGIQFNGDTAAANALDDYEEGTFTPFFYSDTGGEWAGKTTNSCRYTKIGRVVHIFGTVTYSSKAAGAAGTLRIRTLPFTPSPDNVAAPEVGYGNVIPDSGNYKIRLSSTDLLFYAAGVLQGATLISAMPASGTYQINFCFTV